METSETKFAKERVDYEAQELHDMALGELTLLAKDYETCCC